jgi:diguanylate cyclase (GGDEF)-like protein
MTGLPNRVQLAESALARLEAAESFALLCLDLDRFKEVNDTFGHHCGDELLRQVGNRLRSCARQVDAISRLGGDEFAFILGGVRDRMEAARAAKRIVDYLGEPYELEGRHVSIGVSIGIAVAPEHGVEFETLLRRADAALYASKKSGRGAWRMFDDQIDRELQNRRVMEIELRAALGNGELEVVYQPICDLTTGKVCAFEALLRWNHPSRGRIAPGDFIALCEEAGLIGQIGEWVLKTASLQATQWPDDVQVAVNVSPVQFMDPAFVQTVQSALAATGLTPARLELEITESVLMSNSAKALQNIDAIRDFGVRICLDDFGTGYSSLNYLHKFKFDKIKIDQSFIRDLNRPQGSNVIVKTIIDLIQGIGARMTAEGVETIEQFSWLAAAGCHEAQGYLISRPIPAWETNSPAIINGVPGAWLLRSFLGRTGQSDGNDGMPLDAVA